MNKFDKKETPPGPRPHQVFYVCAVALVFLYELGHAHGNVAFALGKTTCSAIMLALLLFGYISLNRLLFSEKQK